MNARAYFQILRPGRTLVVALLYGVFVWFWLVASLQVLAPKTPFFTLAVVGPVLLGSLLIGPLHEVMNRSFFPTLPGARRILRRWHLQAVAITTILLFVPTAIFASDIPGAALYGLIVTGLSIPVLNSRRRTWGWFRWLLIILPGIAALATTVRPALVDVCQYAPWAVLIGGLGSVYVCFQIGFSPQRVRDRWWYPHFFCSQSLFPFIGTNILLQAKARQLAQEQVRSHGRDWSATSIGGSLRDWVRVVHHARFGRGSRIRRLVGFALVGTAPIAITIGLNYFIAKFGNAPTSLALFCRQILEAGKAYGSIDHPQLVQVFTLPPFMGYTMPLIGAIVACFPACSLPISRERLASCLFIDSHVAAASVFVANVLGTVLSFIVISLFAGVPFEVDMLLKPLAAYAIVPPAITLSLDILFLRNAFGRILAGFVVFLGVVMAVEYLERGFAPFVVSPLWLLVCVAATGFAGWLSWLAFRRHYRTCDLNHTGDWLKKLGFNIT